MSQYLQEAFKRFDLLEEEDFNMDASGIDELKSFLDDDKDNIDFTDVIDPEAETEEELEDSYIGKVILECKVCHSKIYKNAEDVHFNEETELANEDEECPFCYAMDGFEIVGQVAPYEETEVKVDVEPKEDQDEEEDDKVEEAFKKRFSRKRGLTESIRKPINESILPFEDLEWDYEDSELEDAANSCYNELIDAIKKLSYITEKYGWLIDEFNYWDDFVEKTANRIMNAINAHYLESHPDSYTSNEEKALIESKRKSLKESIFDNKKQDKNQKQLQIDEKNLKIYANKLLAKGMDKADFLNAVKETTEGSDFTRNYDKNYARQYLRIANKVADSVFTESLKEAFYSLPDSAINKLKRLGYSSKEDLAFADNLYEEDGLEFEEIVDTLDDIYKNGKEKAKAFYRDFFVDEDGNPIEIDESLNESSNAEWDANEEDAKKILLDTANDLIQKYGFNTTPEYVGGGYDRINRWVPDGKISLSYRVYIPLKNIKDQNIARKNLPFNDIPAIWEAERDRPYVSYEGGYILIDLYKLVDDTSINNESLNEGIENLDVETEHDKIHIEAEEKEPSGEEVIAPIEPAQEEDILNDETPEDTVDEVPQEPEEEIDVDEFDEESFDNMGESYLKKVYGNVNSFKTTSIKESGNGFILEGVINFKSGKNKKTSFKFEAKDISPNGKVRFIGENLQFSKGKKAFTLKGTITNNKFISESLNYNYRVDGNRVYGTVKNKSLKEDRMSDVEGSASNAMSQKEVMQKLNDCKTPQEVKALVNSVIPENRKNEPKVKKLFANLDREKDVVRAMTAVTNFILKGDGLGSIDKQVSGKNKF